MKIVIKGNPATKKNSGRIVKRGRFNTILPSKAYEAYEAAARFQLSTKKLQHFTGPVYVEFKYYLRDKAHYPDLIGLVQATQDIISDEYRVFGGRKILAKRWILSDDRIIQGYKATGIYGIDKQNPRVEIEIIPIQGQEIEPRHMLDPYFKKVE